MNSNILPALHKSGLSRSGPYLGRSERGQMAVIIAGSIFVSLLFAGLVIDVGTFWAKRRQMQTAADAGAVAARIALAEKDSSAITPAAKGSTALNGFTDGTNGVSVAVNNGPLTGAYAGNTNYVEVIVSQSQPTYFLRILGLTTMAVSARAVSGMTSAPNCLITTCSATTVPACTTGLEVKGTLNVSCGIAVDASGSSAVIDHSTAFIRAPSIGIVGDCAGCDAAHASVTPVTGTGLTADPFSSLPSPNSPLQPCNTRTGAASAHPGGGYRSLKSMPDTIDPGVYCGGILAQGPLTLNQGTYILCGGGIKVSGSTNSITGSNILLYNTSGNCASDALGQGQSYGAVLIQGAGSMTLSAATTGPYANILMFQDPAVGSSSQVNTINGGSTASLTGALYFPTTELDIGSSGTEVGSFGEIVAYDIKMTGGSLNVGNGVPTGGDALIKAYPLYE